MSKILTKSQAAKKSISGKDMGKKGKGFNKIVNLSKSKYGMESAKKIAGAQFQHMRKKGML